MPCYCDTPSEENQMEIEKSELSLKNTIKIQPAPKVGKISVEKIQRAVDSVSKSNKERK